jgi:hypothetical protein
MMHSQIFFGLYTTLINLSPTAYRERKREREAFKLLSLLFPSIVLGMLAEGPACQRPLSAIVPTKLRRHQRDASWRPPLHYQTISSARTNP